MMHRLLLFVVLLGATRGMTAAAKTWIGRTPASDGLTTYWSVGANWVGAVPPQPGDDLVFPASGNGFDAFNDFPPGTSFGSISVDGGYEFRGNRLQAGSLAVTSNFLWLIGFSVSAPIQLAGSGLVMFGGSIEGPVVASGGFVELLDDASIGNLTLKAASLNMFEFTDSERSSAHVQSISFDSSSRFFAVLKKDQTTKLTSSGPVVLANPKLSPVVLDPNFVFFAEPIMLIDNTSDQPISGVFADLPEGAIVEPNMTQKLKITYVGGTGNDVVLIPQPVATSTTVLTVSPASSTVAGQPFTLEATVQTTDGPATGVVQFVFFAGGEVPRTCDAPLNSQGIATCTTPVPLVPDPRMTTLSISAVWPGTSTIVGSRSETITRSALADIPTLDTNALAFLATALISVAVATLRFGRP